MNPTFLSDFKTLDPKTKILANGLGIEWLANYKFCSVKNKLINTSQVK
jgi:hypothetical protein